MTFEEIQKEFIDAGLDIKRLELFEPARDPWGNLLFTFRYTITDEDEQPTKRFKWTFGVTSEQFLHSRAFEESILYELRRAIFTMKAAIYEMENGKNN